MNRLPSPLLVLLLAIACQPVPQDPEEWKNEIVETERQFAKMAKEKGISEAFLHFAADEAVLFREGELVQGKQAMREWFDNRPNRPDATLSWEPSFVDVSADGSLGYTYGPYSYSYSDSTGQQQTSKGYFHTVWKRQPDGQWKFVWD